MKRILGFACAAVLAAAGSAQAQVWAEIPDAPELPSPGQITVGPGPLLFITGALTGGPAPGGDFADMYCIFIPDPAAFSATVTFFGGLDSQLWLFDLGQMGVTHNDDAVGFLSAIGPAAAPPGPGFAPGHYGLAISGYDYDPVNPAGLEIWADAPFGDETPPDGAGGPLAGWASPPGSVSATGPYEIALTGAFYCEVPAPGATALLGIGGLLAFRRRR